MKWWKPECCPSIQKHRNIRTSLLRIADYTDQFTYYWTFSYDMVKSCNGNSFSFPQLYSHFPYFYSNSHPHDIITVTLIPMGPMGSQLFPFPFTSLIWSCITPAVSGKHCMHSRFTPVWFPRLGRAVCLYSFFSVYFADKIYLLHSCRLRRRRCRTSCLYAADDIHSTKAVSYAMCRMLVAFRRRILDDAGGSRHSRGNITPDIPLPHNFPSLFTWHRPFCRSTTTIRRSTL